MLKALLALSGEWQAAPLQAQPQRVTGSELVVHREQLGIEQTHCSFWQRGWLSMGKVCQGWQGVHEELLARKHLKVAPVLMIKDKEGPARRQENRPQEQSQICSSSREIWALLHS